MVTVKASDHQPNQTYSYLFDTNIWLYIYGPVAGSQSRKQKIYSNLLNLILDRKASIYITSLVLAEYVNRVLRIGFEQWKMATVSPNANFKHDYRKTGDYKETLSDAIAQVKEILRITERRPDDFNAIDINSVLSSMEQSSDYNDSYLVKCCERGGMKFVSDDGDITSINSPITLIKA